MDGPCGVEILSSAHRSLERALYLAAVTARNLLDPHRTVKGSVRTEFVQDGGQGE